jgi:hypothetical protein
MRMTYPEDHTSCVPGNLVSADQQGGYITETFETIVPLIPVFYVHAVEKIIRSQGNITVEYCLAPGQSLPDLVIDNTFGAASLYNATFGDPGTQTYRFAFVEVSGSSITGESKGNAIYFAYRTSDPITWDDQSIRDFTGIVYHEVFHNWNIWYLKWEGAFYEWFVEGGAGFMAAWAAEQNSGPEAGSLVRRDFVEGFRTYKGYNAPRTLENAQKGSAAENSLIYSYGALVWEQLRQKTGEGAFLDGLHEFYTQNGFQSTDFGALVTSLEVNTQSGVETYLDQWLRHNAQIDLSITDVITIQNSSMYETSAQVFMAADRDYEVFTGLGYRTSPTGPLTVVPVHLMEQGARIVTFTSVEKPVYIEIDPDHRVPQTVLNNDAWSG